MSYFGVDIGGTLTKAVLLNDELELLAQATLPTQPDGSPDTLVNRITEAYTLASNQSSEQGNAEQQSMVHALGLSIPGIVDTAAGVSLFAPNLGWHAPTSLAKAVQAQWDVSCTLANDADCAGIGEAHFGAGRGIERFLLLTIGTAVGGSYVVDGVPCTHIGRYGGELGHIPLYFDGDPCSCGINGCFEQYGSARAFVRQAQAAAQKHPSSLLLEMSAGNGGTLEATHVLKAAEAGDAVAQQVIDQFITYLALGTGGLVNIFRPDVVIVGGGLLTHNDSLVALLRKKLSSHVYASSVIGTPPVVVAECGTYAGAYGAATLASIKSRQA